MDLLTQTLTSIRLETHQSGKRDLLTQLEHAGLFRALVTATQDKRVMLDTAFGQLIGKTPENLKKGDEILVKLLPGKNEPIIKIEQHLPKELSLKNQGLNNLFKSDTSTPILAKVVSQGKNQTVLQIAGKNYALNKLGLLQVGETLLLKASSEKTISMIRITPQDILKTALSTLLPHSLNKSKPSGLQELQKLADQILQLKPESLVAKPSAEVLGKTQKTTEPTIKSDLPAQTQAIKQHPTDLKGLQELLSNIARPLANIESFKPQTMLKILTLLSLVKSSETSQSSANLTTFPQQLVTLREVLRQSPDSINQLIRALITANNTGNKSLPPEHIIIDASNHIRSDLIQQTEQALNQLLIQKTSVRLQLEQNHPIQFNLNIPVQIDNEKKLLKLSISEKQRHEQIDEQHWEIQLSFEFGLLGLISSNILLQGKKISAHFWADKLSTKQLIDSQLEQFKTQLQKSGFEMGLFDCFIGQPPKDKGAPVSISDNLVDIEV